MTGTNRPPQPGKRASRPRFALTAAEWRALAVLGFLFIVGVVLLQVRRAREIDREPVRIENARQLEQSALQDNMPGNGKEQAGNGSQVLPGQRNGDNSSYLQGKSPGKGKPIDLNRAGREELEALPGIGPVLAGRILEYRREKGPFLAVEDLKLVRGIGEKRLADLLPLVTVQHTGDIPDGH